MSLTHYRHWYSSQRTPVPELQHSFGGETVIVTGSNTGLGFEAAKHYIVLGASKVILAVRSVEKGDEAKIRLEDATERTGVIEVWTLDMSSYDSIQEFAEKAKSLDRIDVLLENAGMLANGWQTSVDGSEMTMAVNVYGTVMLALLMIPLMRASSRKHNNTPVLTIVASEAHHQTKLTQEAKSGDILVHLDDKAKFNQFTIYGVTKMLEVLYFRELAKHLNIDTHGVVVNTANPGMCYSDFGRDFSIFIRSALGVIQWFIARRTRDGAKALVWPSTVGASGHGKYSLDCGFSEKALSRFVRSEDGAKMQKTLYDGINARLEKVRPGIVQAALKA